LDPVSASIIAASEAPGSWSESTRKLVAASGPREPTSVIGTQLFI
jgi:hypothetical protein